MRGETMTKIQQKLARQMTLVVNCGGKAITALLRMLLLVVAALFEGVSLFFSRLEEVVAVESNETEAARKNAEVRAVSFPAVPAEDSMGRLPSGLVHEPAAILTGTAGGRQRRP
jgi:hypothetical protein